MRDLPLWFLLGTLFFPRICLVVGYFVDTLGPFSLNGWIPPALTILFSRVLVIVLIFQAQGMAPGAAPSAQLVRHPPLTL